MESKCDNVVVVGIGGVSNGGKTTLTDSLEDRLKQEGTNVYVMHQDDYFKEENDVPFHQSGEFRRWDDMVAFHMDQMLSDVKKKIDEFKKSNMKTVFIIEGILIFNHKELNSLFTKRYLLTLSKDVAYERRLTRTYEPADTEHIFDDHVWPMYVKYRDELLNEKTDVTELDGTDSKQDIFNHVMNEVWSLITNVVS